MSLNEQLFSLASFSQCHKLTIQLSPLSTCDSAHSCLIQPNLFNAFATDFRPKFVAPFITIGSSLITSKKSQNIKDLFLFQSVLACLSIAELKLLLKNNISALLQHQIFTGISLEILNFSF